MLGQIIYNRRYSQSMNLKGSKISSLELKKTEDLKFKKINQIQTSRNYLNSAEQQQNLYKKRDQQKIPFIFSHSNSKVLRKSKSEQKNDQKKRPFLFIQSTNYNKFLEKQQQQKVNQKSSTRLYFYTKNLNKSKNLQMNKLFSETDRFLYPKKQQKLKEQNELFKINTTYHSQHQFWRKMKKSISNKKSQKQKQKLLPQAKEYSLEYFYRNTPTYRFL